MFGSFEKHLRMGAEGAAVCGTLPLGQNVVPVIHGGRPDKHGVEIEVLAIRIK